MSFLVSIFELIEGKTVGATGAILFLFEYFLINYIITIVDTMVKTQIETPKAITATLISL